MDNMINEVLIERYGNAKNKLILLDYDGTLVDFSPFPETTIPSEKLLDTLKKLVDKPQTKVIIISGRDYREIDKFLGDLPITIIAGHGAMIKENGKWTKKLTDNVLWKNNVISVLNQITLKCPKSFVEDKKFSLAWHYRNAESKSGYTNSRELIRILTNIIPLYNLKILDGNKVVEVMNKEIGKGKTVKNLVGQDNYDYILAIGDDKTDEEMFEFFLDKPNALTVKVGEGKTFAKYKVDSFNHVIMLLKQLTK